MPILGMENPNPLAGQIYNLLRQSGALSSAGLPGSEPINVLDMLRRLAPGARAPIAESTTVTAPTPTEAGVADPNLPRPPEFLPPGASVAGGGRPRSVGRASPVVTPGTAEGAAPTTSAAPTETAQSPDAANPRDRSMDQLANFGFAMAASRNPSIFGQIGEAGLAMQRGNREDRQDSRQEREVDVMQEYRRAQIRVAEAEAELARDPNSPINVARLMQARAQMLSAQRAGAGGGSGGGGSFVPLENPETGGMTFFNPRTGASVAAPEGFGRPGNASREDRMYQQDVAAFQNTARTNTQTMNLSPDQILQQAEAYANRRREARMRGAPNAPTEGTAPATTNRPVYGVDGRPIAR